MPQLNITDAIDEPAATTSRDPLIRADAHLLPPTGIEDSGLPFSFLVELTLKTLFHGGRLRLWAMSEQLKLPVTVIEPLLEFMRSERLCEVATAASPDGRQLTDICFQLSAAGRSRAEAALQRSQYVGPAPVSLEHYVARVSQQSTVQVQVTAESMATALQHLVLQDDLRNDIGVALNSGCPTLFHGPSGSGKTFIAEHLGAALSGHVYVPHAILVDGEVIQIFDPQVHHAVDGDGHGRQSTSMLRNRTDLRWVLCRRPVVICGGELTLAALDLQFDAHSRFYIAPPQVKANNGLLIIDDLGRQQVSARDLMNRWIVPLDRRVDHYLLHTGKQFSLPFQLSVIFSSNLRPADIADEAFLRRLGYKIHVGEVNEDDYRKLFRQACDKTGMEGNEEIFDHLLHGLHRPGGRPLLACTPFDLVKMAHDRARYLKTPAVLSTKTLDWAWNIYFSTSNSDASQ